MPARPSRLRAWLGTQVPGYILAVTVLGAAAWTGWSGATDRERVWADLGRAGLFPIHELALHGVQDGSYSAIVAAVDLPDQTSLLGFDVDLARESVEALPWVREAVVRTRVTGEVSFEIREAEAVARWFDGRAERLIAADGSELADFVEPHYRHLPLVAGEGADVRVSEARELVATHPFVEPYVAAIVRVGQRRWDLRLINGGAIRLPANAPGLALDRLAGIRGVSRLFAGDPLVIDVRLPGRTSISFGAAAPTPAEPLVSGPAAEDPLAAAILEAIPSDPLAAAIRAAQSDIMGGEAL